MSYDLLIKNGTVVDGTGAPARRADVAVKDGIIAEIGKIKDGAKRVIDASDLHVAPGFVDPHTHYDAQICWDPQITSSSWHGVTTVIMGNCGVGIAPCKTEAHEIAAWDLVNVEGIPFEVLSKGITWDWETFPQYLDAAERRGAAINLGFIAPLTPFRHYVMGEASMERAASTAETAQIKSLLATAFKAGAFGFSTTIAPVHVGYKGRPLACRNASREEYGAYANALKELGRGIVEISLTKTVSVLDDEEYDLVDFLLTESGRPLTWLALVNRDDQPEACQDSLRKAEPLFRRGAIPQVSSRPVTVGLDLRNPEIFLNLDVAIPLLNQPVEVQTKMYRDPKFRAEFREALNGPKALFHGRWEQVTVTEVHKPEMKKLEGRTVADIAAERRTDGLDTLLDLALEDGLQLMFTMELFNAVEGRIAELITDPRTMIGLSDGGAHVDLLCDAGYCTYLLGTWVRDKQVMTLEHAVKRITSEPADFFGMHSRGRLQKGAAADICVFDFNTIGSPRVGEMRSDLPGGGRRIVMPSRGIMYTVVNGNVLYQDGKVGEGLPGRVLRSGSC